ncbi:hypothetical protein [Salinibacter ruber]|uniref:Uncharacterized protein n=1 Tax=Salinibacter ruber TaxID=146919 RepID=A0AAW5P707_9BACT|nr:hypothetical protein [Salinibacter ruber]MCS4157787.1 hypothetical protein [Salinibacter ruber]
MSSELPDPASVVEESLEERSALRDVIKRYTKSDKEADRLTMRVYRYLDDNPGGQKIKEYMLKRRSSYRLNAAARLVTTAMEGESDPIVDLMAEGGVPLVSIASGRDSHRNTYDYWYTRVNRIRPSALSYVQKKEKTPELSIQIDDSRRVAHRPPANYFDISEHELASNAE